jgi:MFS family permease
MVVAISFSTEFFAPGTTMRPLSGPLPRTTITSDVAFASAVVSAGVAEGFTAHQYAPAVQRGGRILTRRWPDDAEHRRRIDVPRDDLLEEEEVRRTLTETGSTTTFTQARGPFTTYERTVEIVTGGEIVERTRYRLQVPWFRWLFAWPIRASLRRRISAEGWWAPPDQLDATQVLVIGLLAAASMSAAFVNTLFTQTAAFAATDFGVDETALGDAGAIVRAGIVIALPAAVLADRIGRRRVLIAVAWLAPTLSVLGAFAPNFPILVATQSVARPMGIALGFLIGVVAAEEMPRNSRAYAISVLAMASGLGASVAVIALKLADFGESGWRLVYVVTIVWCVVAFDLTRRLPETRRFTAHIAHDEHPIPRLDRRRFALLAAVAFAGNVFVAPASFFQNSYLKDIRGFSAGEIAIFSIVVGTPAGIGLIVGGRIADTRGRRRLISIALPLSVIGVVVAFSVGGVGLWASSLVGGVLGAAVFPAMAVYRTELFPTANRTRASGFVTAAALLGGIGGLSLTGRLIDNGWSYGSTTALLAIGQVIATVLVLGWYPETAHLALESLNPEDRDFDAAETDGSIS